jgi:hypothetical protein
MQSVRPLNKHPLKSLIAKRSCESSTFFFKKKLPSEGWAICAPISSEDQDKHATISSPYVQALDGYIKITHRTEGQNTQICFSTQHWEPPVNRKQLKEL